MSKETATVALMGVTTTFIARMGFNTTAIAASTRPDRNMASNRVGGGGVARDPWSWCD